MTTQHPASGKSQVDLALDASIHIGLAILLTVSCLLILRPFIPLLSWGIIIGVAAYPGFQKLQKWMGGRGGLAAIVFSLVLLALLVIPVVLLTGTLVGGIQSLVAHFKAGTLIVPPPPESVASWPLIGAPLKSVWDRASTDLTAAVQTFAPQIKSFLPGVFSASATVGLTVVQFALSIVVAGLLLANAPAAYQLTRSLCIRLFGEKGPDLQQLMGATIRSVTTGILGVAFIQAVLAGLGFLVAGLPGAGLWAVVFLVAAVLQVGAVVLIPAVIYMFTIAGTTKAVIFLVWCVFVAALDNVLKPLLLGRGVAVPIAVVFLGAIGGFLALGLVGLFVGAVVLSVGYRLGIAWLEPSRAVVQEP
ncbi:MAG TPA: AI-2E family transporter [Candidatus Eisenbacteria bacterium]|nr:AI-2E family transporter [Candidatus Eisenbacteria bacterium]